MKAKIAAGLVVGLAGAGTAGCGIGIQDVTLPGGADLGSHPYTVTAQFADVLDLVPQAAVKVNDVAVGRVAKVSLPKDGWSAQVTLLVNAKVRLPANATAHLEQSSLLGEKYIQLAPPKDQPATGMLAGGATIPQDRTTRNPEVEEVFGALSMLLNGGGLPQLRTITRELNNALSGNEPQIRSVLGKLSQLTGSLDANRKAITDALDAVNRLSATLAARTGQISTVLSDLSPGLKVLEEQRGALVGLLRHLDTLSGVATRVIHKSKDDMVADLRALAPTLRRLADAGRDLPASLQVLLTFPFTDEVMKGIKGDYLNTYASVTAVPGTLPIIPPVGVGGGLRVGPQAGPPLPLPPVDQGSPRQGK